MWSGILDYFLFALPSGNPRQRRLEILAVALFSLAVAYSFFPQAIGDVSLLTVFFPPQEGPWSLIGRGIDLPGTLWTFDYVARLTTGQVGIIDGSMFSPLGFDTAASQGCAWADAYMALPLVALRGAPSAYNLYVLLMLSAGVAAGYLLFRGLSAPPILALPLAAIAIDNPWLAKELYQGRPTQAHLIFHLLFLLGVYRLLQGARRNDAVLSGLALALSCLVYWFGGMAVGILGGVAILFELIRSRRKDLLVAAAILGGVALSVALLASWPVVSRWMSGQALPGMDASTGEHLRVGPFRLATGGTKYRIDGPFELWTTFKNLGLPFSATAAFFASFALLRERELRQRMMPWIVGSLAVFTLPLGGAIYSGLVNGKIPTAFALAMNLIPPFQRCHFPERLLVAPILGFLVVAGIAGGALAARAGGKRWIPSVAAGVLCLSRVGDVPIWEPVGGGALLETIFFQKFTAAMPGGIIDVPLSSSNNDYVYQLIHRERLLGGMGFSSPNTRPPGYDEYVQENTFLKAMESLAYAPDKEVTWRTRDVDQLRVDGFQVVLVHREAVSDATTFADYLGQAQGFNQRYAAYSLPAASDEFPGNVTATVRPRK